jgi:isoleucyl-tRNA synthetase
MSQADIASFEQEGTFTFDLGGQACEIVSDDVEIISEDIPGWLVANEGNLTIALDITVTDDLRKEGLARELVNRIQNIRKNNGYEITDQIHVAVSSSKEADEAIRDYAAYIRKQVLAESLNVVDGQVDGVTLDFDEFELSVKIKKV